MNSYFEIINPVVAIICIISMFAYFYNEVRRQDKEFAEWQKEAEKKA